MTDNKDKWRPIGYYGDLQKSCHMRRYSDGMWCHVLPEAELNHSNRVSFKFMVILSILFITVMAFA